MTAEPFETVLCPIDFSPCSANALRAAAWLAKTSSKPLVALHAVHVDMPTYLAREQKDTILEQWREVRAQAEQQLRNWAAQHLPEGVDVRFEVSDAPAVEAIIAAAKRLNAWIVMGTHGRTGWRQVWLGSVTARTMEQAPAPVLAIPPDKNVC